MRIVGERAFKIGARVDTRIIAIEELQTRKPANIAEKKTGIKAQYLAPVTGCLDKIFPANNFPNPDFSNIVPGTAEKI